MGNNGQQWLIMVNNGSQWLIMVNNVIMVNNG